MARLPRVLFRNILTIIYFRTLSASRYSSPEPIPWKLNVHEPRINHEVKAHKNTISDWGCEFFCLSNQAVTSVNNNNKIRYGLASSRSFQNCNFLFSSLVENTKSLDLFVYHTYTSTYKRWNIGRFSSQLFGQTDRQVCFEFSPKFPQEQRIRFEKVCPTSQTYACSHLTNSTHVWLRTRG